MNRPGKSFFSDFPDRFLVRLQGNGGPETCYGSIPGWEGNGGPKPVMAPSPIKGFS